MEAKLVEELAKLFNLIPDPWKITLGVIFLLFFLLDRGRRLWSAWVGWRVGVDALALEKQRLELLKLRYEIEAIRKTHGLAEIAPSIAPAPRVARPVSTHESRPTPTASPPWRWQLRHPRMATVLLRLGQLVLGFYGVISALMGVLIPIMAVGEGGFFSEEGMLLIFGSLFYLLLAYGCYRGYRRFQRSVIAIKAATETPAAIPAQRTASSSP